MAWETIFTSEIGTIEANREKQEFTILDTKDYECGGGSFSELNELKGMVVKQLKFMGADENTANDAFAALCAFNNQESKDIMNIEQTIEALKENGFIVEVSGNDPEDGNFDRVDTNKDGENIKDFLLSLSFQVKEEPNYNSSHPNQVWLRFYQVSLEDSFSILYNMTRNNWFFEEKK